MSPINMSWEVLPPVLISERVYVKMTLILLLMFGRNFR